MLFEVIIGKVLGRVVHAQTSLHGLLMMMVLVVVLMVLMVLLVVLLLRAQCRRVGANRGGRA